MRFLACWLLGHQWYEVSYAPTDQWQFRRTKECLRCGAGEVEVRE